LAKTTTAHSSQCQLEVHTGFRDKSVSIAAVRESGCGLVSRVTPVHTAVRNCTGDEGGPFEVGNQVLISSHRKLLSSKAMVVNVAEKPEQDFGRHD
jgi:hypothetical protein